jgi:hypothetical protein
MSKGKRLFLLTISLGLVVGLLLVSVGGYAVRKPWPQTEGNEQAEGLLDEVDVYRDSWGYLIFMHQIFMICFLLKVMFRPKIVSGKWNFSVV